MGQVKPGEAEAYQAVVARGDRRANRIAVGALAGSLLLPLILVATDPSWYPLVFFGCALIVHELGHQASARLLGHRPGHLFLATLFGASAVATRESPERHFWVHLWGAVPGLLLGGLLLLGPGPLLLGSLEWTGWFGTALLGVSLMSLLPMPATDGAEILDAVLLRGAPRLSFYIQVTALVIFYLAALAAILLLFLAALPLIFAAVRASRRSRLRKYVLGSDPPPAIESPQQALQVVSDAGFGHLSFPRRCRLAGDLLARSSGPPLRTTTALAFAGIYLLALSAAPAIEFAAQASRDSALQQVAPLSRSDQETARPAKVSGVS